MKEITKKWGFFGNVLDSLIKVGLPLIKNVVTSLAKDVFITLGLIAAASEIVAAIQRKTHGYWLYW